jgi:hypothetical protein
MVLHIWLIAKFGFMDDHLFFYIFLKRSPLVLHVPIDDRHFLANNFLRFLRF